MKALRWLFVALTVLVAAPAAAQGPDSGLPGGEQRKIESLIALVEKASDMTFIRNGATYDAQSAARFLRAKWEYQRTAIMSAEDFIRKIASRSGTTGMAYRVRRSDGTEEDSERYLTRLLATKISG